MTDIHEMVDQEVEELRDRDYVKAVGLVGSYARDPEGDHNDIDIYVIVKGDWRKRVNKRIEGIMFEEFFNSIEGAKSYFNQGNKHYYVFHWMRNIDIRYDPDELISELKEYASDKEDEILEIDEEDRRIISLKIWDYLQDIDNEDVGQQRHLMNRFMDYLVEKNYILSDRIPVKQNYRIEKLQDFDGYMYKLAQDYLTSSSTLEKKQKIEKMAEHVRKKTDVNELEFETEKEFFNDQS